MPSFFVLVVSHADALLGDGSFRFVKTGLSLILPPIAFPELVDQLPIPAGAVGQPPGGAAASVPVLIVWLRVIGWGSSASRLRVLLGLLTRRTRCYQRWGAAILSDYRVGVSPVEVNQRAE
jgi:hypothetical protein